MKIYTKLCEARDNISKSATGFEKDEKLKILSQLIVLSFTNDFQKDHIPEVFYIKGCRFSSKEIKEVFESFGIPVQSVTYTSTEKSGNTFQVIQKAEAED